MTFEEMFRRKVAIAGSDARVINAELLVREACIYYYSGGNEILASLLKVEGVDVNTTPKGQASALMIAIERRNLVAVRLLIKAGADVNAQHCDRAHNNWATPLLWGLIFLEEDKNWYAPPKEYDPSDDARILHLLLTSGVDGTIGHYSTGITPRARIDSDSWRASLYDAFMPKNWEKRAPRSPFCAQI